MRIAVGVLVKRDRGHVSPWRKPAAQGPQQLGSASAKPAMFGAYHRIQEFGGRCHGSVVRN
jgi:hypothetical protein